MKIALIDNYDSFTYNLDHLIKSITPGKIDVFRNDRINPEILDEYDKIVLSPGPGIPSEAGLLKEIITRFAAHKSIFGVCLGLQAIAEVFGGSLSNMSRVYHGVETEIIVNDRDEKLYKGVPAKFTAGRYHSWIVNSHDLPECFRINALDNSGNIMGLTHTRYDVRGVQFHPESILTPDGKRIMANWLDVSLKKIILPTESSKNFDITKIAPRVP